MFGISDYVADRVIRSTWENVIKSLYMNCSHQNSHAMCFCDLRVNFEVNGSCASSMKRILCNFSTPCTSPRAWFSRIGASEIYSIVVFLMNCEIIKISGYLWKSSLHGSSFIEIFAYLENDLKQKLDSVGGDSRSWREWKTMRNRDNKELKNEKQTFLGKRIEHKMDNSKTLCNGVKVI